MLAQQLLGALSGCHSNSMPRQPSDRGPVFGCTARAGCISLLALAAVTWGSGSAQAQQVVADGITHDVAGPFSTSAGSEPVFRAINGGIIQNIPGVSVQVTSSGDNSNALTADSNGKILLGAGTSFETSGGASHALSADNGGEIQIQGATLIKTTGNNSHALIAENGSTISIGAGTVIETAGTGSGAVYARSNSTVSVTGAAISTAQSASVSTGLGATITITDSTVTSVGSGGIGMLGGSITLDNTSLQAYSLGASLQNVSSLTLRNNSAITTTQPGGTGVRVSASAGGSTVTVNDSSIHVQGAGTAAVLFAINGTFNADGATVTSDDGAAFSVTGGTLGATLTDSTITGTNLLSVGISGATLNMYAASSTLTGAATTASGATAQLNLLGTSVWNITTIPTLRC